MKTSSLGVYVHIPFCLKKCNYCDFVSYEQVDEGYVSHIAREIEEKGLVYGNKYYVDTIHFGGGTPSVLEVEDIGDTISEIGKGFEICDPEITIEVNPGTVEIEKLKGYRKLGVNRLSIGIQSFDNDNLKLLGRIHTRDMGLRAYEAAREAGFDNINLDLMIGLPGQNMDDLIRDVESVIALDPEHVSCYSLQYEEGTPLHTSLIKGEIQALSDELDRDMYHEVCDRLKAYNHYEISNFAKNGYESMHNLKYWSMSDYLGIGVAAHSYIQGVRFANPKRLEEYLKGTKGEFFDVDTFSEYMFTGLRKLQGLKLDEIEKICGDLSFLPKAEGLISEGLLEIDDDRLKLTSKGIDISNRVFMEFLP